MKRWTIARDDHHKTLVVRHEDSVSGRMKMRLEVEQYFGGNMVAPDSRVRENCGAFWQFTMHLSCGDVLVLDVTELSRDDIVRRFGLTFVDIKGGN